MKLKILATCLLAVFLTVGCQTTGTVQQPPPAGCETSLIYKNKVVIDTVLTVAIMAVHVAAAERPAWYTLTSAAAKEAAALLKKQSVTLMEITQNPYLNVLTPLLGLLPMDQLLSECDRNYLAAMLLQV